MTTLTDHHLAPDMLLAYWLHETDAPTTAQIDEHLLHCDDCGRTLDELVAIGAGVREALLSGLFATCVGAGFVDRLKAQGTQVREYSLAPGGSVNCSVAAGDQMLVSRLAADLAGVERIDLVATSTLAPGVEHRMEDVPFDAQQGEVLLLADVATIRQQPAHDLWLTLQAVQPQGARTLGTYLFRHFSAPPPAP